MKKKYKLVLKSFLWPFFLFKIVIYEGGTLNNELMTLQ